MVDDRDRSHDADPPLTVTIEPSRNKNSYQAKEYRLNRIRHLLEKKTYHVQKWTMIFMMAYTGLTLIIAVASIVASYEAKKSTDLTRHVFEDNDSADVQLFVRQREDETGEIHLKNIGKFPSRQQDVSFSVERIQVSDGTVLETVKADSFSNYNLRPYDINIENEFKYFFPSNVTAFKKQIDAGEMAFRVQGTLSYDNGFDRPIRLKFCWETFPNNSAFASWENCNRANVLIKANAHH